MTYIVIGNTKESQKTKVTTLLVGIFGKEIEESPDIHAMDTEEVNSIGIEEIKEFQKKLMYKPFEEVAQVGIIWEAEKLTSPAQNALLKTLEESPDHSIYILCTRNSKNLLPTITSRGRSVYAQEEYTDDLLEEKQEENILDQDIVEQFQMIEKYQEDKVSALEFLNILEQGFKTKLELDIKNGNIDSSKKNKDILKAIQSSREKIASNCNRKLTLEALIMELNA